MELYFEISPKLQSWIRILCTSLMNIIKYTDYELLVPYSMISKPLLYLPKRKKVFLWQLVVLENYWWDLRLSRADCVYISKPSQRGLPGTALPQAGHPSGWSLDAALRCRAPWESAVVSLTCEDKTLIRGVSLLLVFADLTWAFWWDFLHHTAYCRTLDSTLIQQMASFDILNCWQNVLLTAECSSPNFNLINSVFDIGIYYRVL